MDWQENYKLLQILGEYLHIRRKMNTITDLIKAFMILVNAGGIFRIITLIFSTINDPDSKETNFRRGRNVILFMILTILIYSFKDSILEYYQ